MTFQHRLTYQFAENYLHALDTPRSLAVWLLLKNDEHVQLLGLEIDPHDYADPNLFRLDYLATKFLSKADFLNTSIKKDEVAIEKFKDAERQCARTNSRGYHHLTVNSVIGASLHCAVLRKIDSLLGDFSCHEWFDLSSWGPGASLDVKRPDLSATNKFRRDGGITPLLDALTRDLMAVAYPSWDVSSRKKFHKGSKVITVPKNSKTDRTIAVEPGLNLWFQKGIGEMIRRRLRRVGVNLNNQTRNQKLAKVGSLNGSLATVDFSAASDTVSKATVRELIPERWLDVMERCRTHYGRRGKEMIAYEKFSSMGNGFTFELESLIFFSIAFCVVQQLGLSTKDVSVYGDDVILPNDAYPLFVKTCEFYGFTVNLEKSFSSSEFRESCGAHWFRGLDCTPFYLKEIIATPLRIYHTANSVRRTAHSGVLKRFPYCDIRFYACWRHLRFQIRKPNFTSAGYGDGAFHVNFDEASPSRARDGLEGFFTRVEGVVASSYECDDAYLLLSRLSTRSLEMDFGNKVNLTGKTRPKKTRVFVPRWFNFGPWM